MNAEITITSDEATPELAKLMDSTSPQKLARVCRQPLETFMRVHLNTLPRNKQGWPSTGFWEDASRSTIAIAQADGSIRLQVRKLGVRQRAFGGHIAPVEAQALAIPISPVSYGHLPREFPGLFLLKTPKGAYLVQPGEQISERTSKLGPRIRGAGGNSGRRRAAGLIFLFKLSGGVDQGPNPNVIPSNDQFQEVALAAIERSLKDN